QIDAAFGALYGYAHDRVSIAWATPHLALDLFGGGPEERGQAWSRLSPEAPLRRFVLLTTGGAMSMLSPLETDERIARFLIGENYVDPRLQSLLVPLAAGHCPERHRPSIDALTSQMRTSAQFKAVICGPPRSGRRAAAAEVASQLGLGLAELKTRHLPDASEARGLLLALLAREAALGTFAVLVDGSAATGPQAGGRSQRDTVEDLLQGIDGMVLAIADQRLDLAASVPQVRLAPLDAADRHALWRRSLVSPPDADELEKIAEHFPLSPAKIAEIAKGCTQAEALWPLCREHSGRELADLAERMRPRFGWDDIVLPAHFIHDLKALVSQVEFRAQVYGRGGFGRKLVRGRGVTALFAGPSGVGKTMAAEVVASALGLDLCRIDLSGIISKYIGETERNLRRVFDAAEAGGAVLFFDEADALFGKRSEVKDSHDRYANIEVSYLLQRMEAYSGLAILATNLKSHLDTAFLRRLRYVIDIPFPDAGERRAIWQKAFPPETAVHNLDFDLLSRLDIAGGNIMVVAVNAAFLAAAEKAPVGMSHIARAARSEFRKLDRELRLPWTMDHG
ncbi:MAG TPA: ATP-binding protein, partial [Rhizomicrobium sp.]